MDVKLGQIPFVRLFIPLASGIIAALNFKLNTAIIYFSVFFFILLLLWRLYENKSGAKYPLRWVYGALIALFLFTTGYSLILLHTPSQNKSDISNYISSNQDSLIVSIISIPEEKEKTIKATIEVKGISKDGKFISTTGKALFYFHKDSNTKKLSYGDELHVYSKLNEIEPPSNPNEFDYRRFLHNKGIYYEGYAVINSHSIVATQNIASLQQFTNTSRKKLVTLLDKKIGGDPAHVASAILLGYREDLSRSVVQTFVDSGTVHVICVAGLHVGIFFLLLGYLIVFPTKWKNGKLYSTILIILLLWLYALFTGLATPVLRATVMFSFLTIGQHFRKYTNSINTIAASAFLLLLFDPFAIADSGFQLSYLSVLGILLIYKPILSLFETENFILKKIWELVCVSASAQIAIFPLSLLYFHQFPNYFLFTNILVVPLLTVVIFSGILFFLTSWIPFVSTCTAWVLQKSLLLINFIVSGASHLPYSVSKGISISTPEALLLYAFLISIFVFFIRKKFKPLFIGLSSLGIFFVVRVSEEMIHSRQNVFAVYNIPNKSACAFISGKKCVMVEMSSLHLIDSNDINYHLQYHWWNLGVKENKIVTSDTDATLLSGRLMLQNQFAQFNTYKMAFINSDAPLPSQKISLQHLIISSGCKLSMSDLKNAFNFETIIFDSSVPMYQLKKWKDECKSLNIPFYDVRTQGAFILKC